MRERSRYFITLQQEGHNDFGRREDTAVCRRRAEAFVGDLHLWLRDRGFDGASVTLSVTAFGQVLMTCEDAVVRSLREDVTPFSASIAAIRPAPKPGENFARGPFATTFKPFTALVEGGSSARMTGRP